MLFRSARSTRSKLGEDREAEEEEEAEEAEEEEEEEEEEEVVGLGAEASLGRLVSSLACRRPVDSLRVDHSSEARRTNDVEDTLMWAGGTAIAARQIGSKHAAWTKKGKRQQDR